jgi:hypothetical protein
MLKNIPSILRQVSPRGMATASPRIGDTKVIMSQLDKGTRQSLPSPLPRPVGDEGGGRCLAEPSVLARLARTVLRRPPEKLAYDGLSLALALVG